MPCAWRSAALSLSHEAAERLVRVYIDQVFNVRHQRQPRLDTTLGCRLQAVAPQGPAAAALTPACNTVYLPLAWKDIEPSEAHYNWEPHDAVLAWAEGQGLTVSAGPLVDFGPGRLPRWLELWDHDVHSIASFMCDYVETAVKRYHGRIRSWQLTTASNAARVLGLGEDEVLWLTVRLAEAARQIDSGLELVVGLSQPWGEYMALEDRTHSPFIFADTLIRAGLNLAAVDLEWVMGVTPHGSYCRDILEASRLLDLYALLGVPLQVTLAYPSASGCGCEGRQRAARRRRFLARRLLAGSAGRMGLGVRIAGPVQALRPRRDLAHFSDAEPHQYSHCGLVDASGTPKPAPTRCASCARSTCIEAAEKRFQKREGEPPGSSRRSSLGGDEPRRVPSCSVLPNRVTSRRSSLGGDEPRRSPGVETTSSQTAAGRPTKASPETDNPGSSSCPAASSSSP